MLAANLGLGYGLPTRMTGHRLRTESLANEVGSLVTDLAGGRSTSQLRLRGRHGSHETHVSWCRIP